MVAGERRGRFLGMQARGPSAITTYASFPDLSPVSGLRTRPVDRRLDKDAIQFLVDRARQHPAVCLWRHLKAFATLQASSLDIRPATLVTGSVKARKLNEHGTSLPGWATAGDRLWRRRRGSWAQRRGRAGAHLLVTWSVDRGKPRVRQHHMSAWGVVLTVREIVQRNAVIFGSFILVADDAAHWSAHDPGLSLISGIRTSGAGLSVADGAGACWPYYLRDRLARDLAVTSSRGEIPDASVRQHWMEARSKPMAACLGPLRS